MFHRLRRTSSEINSHDNPKGSPKAIFEGIRFWLTDPKILLKTSMAPTYTYFEGAARGSEKLRNVILRPRSKWGIFTSPGQMKRLKLCWEVLAHCNLIFLIFLKVNSQVTGCKSLLNTEYLAWSNCSKKYKIFLNMEEQIKDMLISGPIYTIYLKITFAFVGSEHFCQ